MTRPLLSVVPVFNEEACMADADLWMPTDNIGRCFAALRESSTAPHVLIGSREAIGALRVGEPWQRHAAGRVFNLMVQAVGVADILRVRWNAWRGRYDGVPSPTAHGPAESRPAV